MGELEDKARALATRLHAQAGNVRKYTSAPYIVHPAEVAELVRGVPHTEEMLAAAWLHDTVEDAGATFKQIHQECGPDVASLVSWLTDVSTKADGNRAARKALDRDHLAQAPPMAKTVKLADLISNSDTIVRFDPDFARVYLKEKAALLEVLKSGDPTLYARAQQVLRDGLAALG